MKVETLADIAKTASRMNISVTLGEDGLTFELSKGMYGITGLLLWNMLEASVDPYGLSACTMGNMFNAMKQAEAENTGRPQ